MALVPIADRREFIGPIVDALMTYWLQATHDHDELREWWENEAPDAALEMAHTIRDHLEERGIFFGRLSEENV